MTDVGVVVLREHQDVFGVLDPAGVDRQGSAASGFGAGIGLLLDLPPGNTAFLLGDVQT